MRLLPLQIKMYMLAGEWLPFCEPKRLSLTERIRNARQKLVKATGRDFGYDLIKWHEYLVENHPDGYCWSDEHVAILDRIQESNADPEWRKAVAILKAEDES